MDEAALVPLLPSALEVATADGSAWVSLVLFEVRDARPPLLPAPTLPPFAETNLRTYVRLPDGREAIWFFSLDARSVTTVAGGRFVYGVPYHRAIGSVDAVGPTLRHRSRRRVGGIGHDLTVRVGESLPDAERTELVDWLTGRWRAVSVHLGLLLETIVDHEPWPLRSGELTSLSEDLLAGAGLRRPSGPPLVHCADAVHARLSVPRPVGRPG
jgi:uncharacterized protein